MAESTLSLKFSTIRKSLAHYLGYGRYEDTGAGLTSDEQADVAEYFDEGIRDFLGAYNWTFRSPVISVKLWSTVAESTVTATSSTATLTATANSFQATMVGRNVKINALSGTDDGTLALATGETTLTATTAIFTTSSDDVGATLKFDTSGESYTISSVTSTTVVKLTGDATATTTNASDTFKVYREYTIGAYTSAEVVTLTATPNPTITAKLFSITADGLYRMPESFGGIIGPLTFQNNAGAYCPIEMGGERQVAELLQRSTSTSRPTLAAQRPVSGTSATLGQRWDLLVWRIPDQDYTAYFKSILLIDQVGDDEFPPGGMLHGDTIKYACLAAAELGKNDRGRGPMWDRYQQELQKSKRLDDTLHRSESLGTMTDGSDRGMYHPSLSRINHTVTVQGTSP
jgi:hypothetical protein